MLDQVVAALDRGDRHCRPERVDRQVVRRRRGIAGRIGGHRRHQQQALARRRHRGGTGAAGVNRHRRAIHRQGRADLRRSRDPS